MDAARYQIFGRVQGVGYRYFAQRAGQELQLRGWVKNLPDGSVAVAALGQETQLRQFEQCLRTGPPAAQVTRIEVHPWQPEPKESAALQGFLIASE